MWTINTAVTLGQALMVDATGAYTLSGAGSITLQNDTLQAAAITIGGSQTINVPLMLMHPTTVTVDGTLSFGGWPTSFAGTASRQVKAGSGTLAITAAQTYAGTVVIAAGTLPNWPAARWKVCGGLHDRRRIGCQRKIALLLAAFSGTSRFHHRGESGGALTFGGSDAASSFSGTITGTGSIAKIGTATLFLSGANDFSGGILLSAGKLNVTS